MLALNGGSSSLRFGLYRVRSLQTQRLVPGETEWIGEKAAVLYDEDPKGNSVLGESAVRDVDSRTNGEFNNPRAPTLPS